MSPKTVLISGVFICCFLTSQAQSGFKNPVYPLQVIFDTDFGPDYDDVGAITLLHCFADMAAMRRSADRHFKQLRGGSDSVRQERTNVEHLERSSSESSTAADQLTKLVRMVLEERGLQCDKCDVDFEVQLPKEGPINGAITVEYWCPRHCKSRKAEISLDELRKADSQT
jgi:hypothetical protein